MPETSQRDTLHFLAMRVARKADNLAQRAADVERHTTRELHLLDGYPSATLGDGTPRGEAELNGVERAAEQRRNLTIDLDQVRDDLIALDDHLASVQRLFDRLGTLRVELPAPDLCTCGKGREGALEWGDPLCRQVAESRYGGLCVACYHRERRWRIAHDLPTRQVHAPA